MNTNKAVRCTSVCCVLVLATAGLFAQARQFILDDASLAAAIADERGLGLFQFSFMQENLARGSLLVTNGERPDEYGSPVRVARDAPFHVSVFTPYMRASMTAVMARRRQAPVPQLTPQMVNDDGIVISVGAGKEYTMAASLVDLVLRRADDPEASPIQPFKRSLEPQTIKGAFGGTRQVTVGAFYFHFKDFEHFPLLIQCIGSPEGLNLRLEEADLPR